MLAGPMRTANGERVDEIHFCIKKIPSPDGLEMSSKLLVIPQLCIRFPAKHLLERKDPTRVDKKGLVLFIKIVSDLIDSSYALISIHNPLALADAFHFGAKST